MVYIIIYNVYLLCIEPIILFYIMNYINVCFKGLLLHITINIIFTN